MQPVTLHYRNKNEFHIRYDSDGRAVVGLCVGKASKNTLRCITAEKLLNTHPFHSNVAQYVVVSRTCSLFLYLINVISSKNSDISRIISSISQNGKSANISNVVETGGV